MNDINDIIDAIANSCFTQQEKKAMQQMQDFAAKSGPAFSSDEASMRQFGMPKNESSKLMEQIVTALENQDYVLAGDLMTYGLRPERKK